MKHAEPIEIIKLLDDKKELKKYIRNCSYPIPTTYDHLFNSRKYRIANYLEDEKTEAQKRKGLFRLVYWYLIRYTKKPQQFTNSTHYGKMYLLNIIDMIDYCRENEWAEMMEILVHIKINTIDKEEF